MPFIMTVLHEIMFVCLFLFQIEVTPEIMAKYNELFVNHKLKWVSFKIKDKKELVCAEESCESAEDGPEAKVDKDEVCWKSLVEALKDDEPRYILYDVSTRSGEGRIIKKCIFVSW